MNGMRFVVDVIQQEIRSKIACARELLEFGEDVEVDKLMAEIDSDMKLLHDLRSHLLTAVVEAGVVTLH